MPTPGDRRDLPPPATVPDTAGRSGGTYTAALALAAGKTVAQAARDAGVGERTVYRWLKKAKFTAMVSHARGRMVDAAAGILSDRMADGAKELHKLLKNKDPNVRLRAAVKLLELGVRTHEYADLEGRVRQLEERRQEAAGDRRPRAVETVIGDDQGGNP